MNNNPNTPYGRFPAGYPPQNAPFYPYDQVPSTSGMPFPQILPRQPLNPTNQMTRNAAMNSAIRQGYMYDWIGGNPFSNPSNSYPCSPAHSVMSHASVRSFNSVASGFSQLTINTNMTAYSYMNPAYMNSLYQPPGTENQYPPGGVQWTQKEVDHAVMEIIDRLSKNHLHQIEIKQIVDPIEQLLRGKEKNQVAPIDCLDNTRYLELLTALFSAIVFQEDYLNKLTPTQLTQWNNNVKWILKYLTRLQMQTLNKFDPLVDKVQVQVAEGTYRKVLYVIAILIHPDREYTYNALTFVNAMFRLPQEQSRKTARVRQVVKEFSFIIQRLIAIVIPSREYLNYRERQLALDTITFLAKSKDIMAKILESQLIPEMLRLYFKPDGDEEVLHKIPPLLQRLAFMAKPPRVRENPEVAKIIKAFFTQFEAVNGYMYFCKMLTHGSPRVLMACLKFLGSLENDRIQKIPCLDQLVTAVLKLVGSSEVKITQPALQFLFNAVANNHDIKKVVTEKSGVEILLAALRQHYHSAFDHGITAEKLKPMEKEIRSNGLKILTFLVKPYDSEKIGNPDRLAAIRQALRYPDLSGLICNWLSEEHDEERIEIIRFFYCIMVYCVEPQNCAAEDQTACVSVLTRNILLDDRSKETTVTQSFVELFITLYIYNDQIIEAQPPSKRQRREQLVMYLINDLVWLIGTLCLNDKAREIVVKLLGMPEPQNLTRLFRVTGSDFLRVKLLELMFRATQNREDPLVRQLPVAWVADIPFYSYLGSLANHPQGYPLNNTTQQMSIWARHLLSFLEPPKPQNYL